jgi:hypothetical protein
MWEILEKMCKQVYPGLREGKISNTKCYMPKTKRFQLVKYMCISQKIKLYLNKTVIFFSTTELFLLGY